MCLIVDANLASRVFSIPPEEDFRPLLVWLREKDGCLVIGGHLTRELGRVAAARRFVLTLERAGRARRVADSLVHEEEQAVDALRHCVSNDRHVVALARVSGARTLCTLDGDLQRDFKNRQLVNPRGSIYKSASHTHLLRHSRSCGRRTRRR